MLSLHVPFPTCNVSQYLERMPKILPTAGEDHAAIQPGAQNVVEPVSGLSCERRTPSAPYPDPLIVRNFGNIHATTMDEQVTWTRRMTIQLLPSDLLGYLSNLHASLQRQRHDEMSEAVTAQEIKQAL